MTSGTSWDIYHIQTRKYVYYVLYTYIYIDKICIHPSQPFRQTELFIITAHISPHSSSIFNLPALEDDLSLRAGDWFTMVDPSMLTPHPRFPTSSHQVTNSKVMWDEPRWIQHQHSLKNAVIWGVPERHSWWMKQRDGFKFLDVLCFCFHKTISQNFWTISGWIWVKLVPKFHLAIWPFQETVAEEWLQLHYPSGSIWFVRVGFVVMNIHHHHPSLK